MSFLGNVGIFEENQEDFESYQSRVELFFVANDVEQAKYAASFLSLIGPKAYKLVKSLVAPKKPSECTYAYLTSTLKNHYTPQKIVIYERFKFLARAQKDNESVNDYVAALKELASTCEYGTNLALEEMLRDRLVCGLKDEATQRHLLAIKDLTFAQAYDAAVAREAAQQDVEAMGASSKPNLTNKVQNYKSNPNSHSGKSAKEHPPHNTGTKPKNKTLQPDKPCSGCGGRHWKSNCKFKNASCHKCNKKGHLAKMCFSNNSSTRGHTQTAGTSNYSTTISNVPNSSVNSDYNNDYIDYIHYTYPKKDPFMVGLVLDNVEVSFELDTGASRTLMSKSTFSSIFRDKVGLKHSSVTLKKYGNVSMKICGETSFNVSYLGSTPKSLTLLVVKDQGPSLLGRDWMQALNFDMSRILPVTANQSPNTIGKVDEKQESLKILLREFSDVFQPGLGTLKNQVVHIDVDETVPPKFCKARPVPYALKAKVDQEIDRLLDEGIIRPVSHAQWACPTVPVVKPNGSIRLCGDYKLTANKAVRIDTYPLPRDEELFTTLTGSKIFAKLDMSQAYAQLPLDEESKKYTTINTHRGLFEYNRLCFGISSAPAIFQRTLENLLRGLSPCFLDDVPIGGKDDKDLLEKLRKILSILQEAGLRLNKEKCQFFLKEITYLGFKIDANGIHPLMDKVEAIQKALAPKNVTELQAYLGLLNFYRRFIPNAANVLEPLNRLLRSENSWKWEKEQQMAFDKSKEILLTSKCLMHFDPKLPIVVSADSSSYGVGAVISHVVNGAEHPVCFASRTLSDPERRYSQLEKEALALVFALKKFHYYLYLQKFTLITDHKPLLGIFSPDKPISAMASGRIQRWCLMLQGYNFNLVHKSGKYLGNADALSRLPLPNPNENIPVPAEWIHLVEFLETTTPITYQKIAEWTEKDHTFREIKKFCLEGWPNKINNSMLKPFFHRKLELSIQSGCLLWGSRVVVPPQGQEVLLQELHAEHVGSSRMKELARSYFWWPGLDEAIEQVVQNCQHCLIHRKAPPKAKLHPWEWPSEPWHRIHVDFAEPTKGNYFLIVVDAHSKWVEIFPTKSITSRRTIDILRTCFARFGLPVVLVSDNGSQLTSREFLEYLSSMGIRHAPTSVCKPSTNGLAENMVSTFKSAVTNFVGEDMQSKLQKFLLKYRITPHTTTGVSPAELMFGRKVRTIFDLLRPGETRKPPPKFLETVERRVHRKQEAQKYYYSKGNSRKLNLQCNDSVMARNYGQGPKWIPAVVESQTGPLSYKLVTRNGVKIKRHQDQIWQDKRKNEIIEVPTPNPVIPTTPVVLPTPVLTQATPPSPAPSPPVIVSKSPTVVLPSPVNLRRFERVRKPPDRMNL